MKLFKGAINVGDTAKNLLDKLDDSSLTQQEKADRTRAFVIETLSENTERSKTRRMIAKVVIYNYFAVFWVVILAYVIKLFTNGLIDLDNLINIIVKFQIPIAFLTVIAFFFGGYYFGKYQKDKKK